MEIMDAAPLETAVRWIVSTQNAPWQPVDGLETTGLTALPDDLVRIDDPKQEIEGFGASFNELGWTSLGAL